MRRLAGVFASAIFFMAHGDVRPEPRARSSAVVWEKPIQVAAGGGHRGPWRMNASEYDFVDDATVAVSPDGAVTVAWVDQRTKDVFLQVYEPDGKKRLTAPVNVSRSPQTFSWLPRLVVDPNGAQEVYLLWQEIIFSGGSHGGEILFARSTDGGATFSNPLNLSNSEAGDGKGRLSRADWHNGSLDLAMDAAGQLYATWTEYEGRLWFCRSSDGGGRFSTPLHVAGDDRAPARAPSLAVGAAVVHLAWTVGEDPRADIRVATSGRGSGFGAARVVAPGPGHADAPRIASDRKGTLHLVYAERSAGSDGYRIQYTRSTDGARTFASPKAIASPQLNGPVSVGFPALALGGEGDVFIMWERFADQRGRPRELGYTVSRDGGRTFAPLSVVPEIASPALGTNGSQQGLLTRKVSVAPSGACAVVNSTFAAAEASHIWLLRGRILE